MKIKNLMAAMLLMATVATPSFAQTKQECKSWKDGWFVSLGAGAQVYFGEADSKADFGDRIAPALDFAVGKWFTQSLGARVMYSGLKQKGATLLNTPYVHGTGKAFGSEYQGQEFKWGNLHADFLFNVTSFYWGEKENRVWNCIPYVGIGAVRCFSTPRTKGVSGNFGVINSFRVAKNFDINVDFRTAVVSEGLDSEKGGGTKGEGNISLNFGLTYNF